MCRLLRIRDDCGLSCRSSGCARESHAQMKLIERLRFHVTNSALPARRLAGLALALALAGALIPGHVEAAATVDGQFAELGMRGAGVTTALAVANRGGVPGNATAVTLNVTSTGSLGGGFATVYPCGTPRPNTSNINFAAGSTVANAVTTKVGADGAVCIYNDAATHLIVDVTGYYLPPTANFGALEPARLLDTRNSAIPGAGVTTALVVANRGGVPGNATAVTLNVTSTGVWVVGSRRCIRVARLARIRRTSTSRRGRPWRMR